MNPLSPFEGFAQVRGCELIQKYYTSRENIVRLKSDLRFESIISYNINFPKSVTSPPQPLS